MSTDFAFNYNQMFMMDVSDKEKQSLSFLVMNLKALAALYTKTTIIAKQMMSRVTRTPTYLPGSKLCGIYGLLILFVEKSSFVPLVFL